ncbi:hypothetical protein K0M31_002363 [Melipona bicolor]|uniref:Uncharacterized protein n=1 Tax=Melipona bicolor TaxID=60889 RepID=A0AA40KYG7_9HYME|nr:hypothetical protein K0M31_002363 [Melipona bicolor]
MTMTRGWRNSPWVCPSSKRTVSWAKHGGLFALREQRGTGDLYTALLGTSCANDVICSSAAKRLRAACDAVGRVRGIGHRLRGPVRVICSAKGRCGRTGRWISQLGTWTLDIHGDSRIFASTIFGRELLSVTDVPREAAWFALGRTCISLVFQDS